MSRNGKGAMLSLLAFGFYATSDALVKDLGGHYSPFQLIFFSTLFSFPLAMGMIVHDPQPGTLRPIHPGWIALRSAAAVLSALSVFYAFSVLPLAQVYAIAFAQPLLITLLAIPLLGERVGLRRALAVAGGLLGVLVVLRPGSAHLSLGHLAALSAAVFGAISSVIVRKVGHEERPVVMLLYPMIANLALTTLVMPSEYRPMAADHLGLIAAQAVLGWLGGVVIIAAYKAGEAVTVAPMQYVQILFATVYGYLLFGETIDGTTAIGAGIIIASGLYIVLREDSPGTSANRPVLSSRLRPETGAPRPSVLQRLAGRRAPALDPHATPCE
ncbi:Membrane protein, putative [Rubellimicrobium mesophilum DSM 19309]|uniref:Membrane protein, putative n=1 Tax=Rubellimicrobium mesophilum DSM 19309 TaxID=442562 RepID=A0A017HMU4_9RHOB|nr:DMT family transporter [Rubellimicrobium mesophilum]EYD75696.1 Membrane protein, putative [Rubellimicrobium mesophilum DSM 19309]